MGRGTALNIHHGWAIAAPFVVLWCLRPRWRWVVDPRHAAADIERERAADSHGRRARSWRFFETFVTTEDHALPPDNFQDDPRPVVAHRTSPTNMGLYLLSTAAARDLGWIGTLDMVDRLGATLATMAELERFRGHFYNWYDTRTLKPLEPRYVSSVDSGNLAGHLSVLAVAARERSRQPLVGVEVRRGIEAALALLHEASPTYDAPTPAAAGVRAAVGELRGVLSDEPATTVDWAGRLADLAVSARNLSDRARALDPTTSGDALVWADEAQKTIASHRRDLDAVAPWIEGLDDLSRRLPAENRTAMSALARLLGPPVALEQLPSLARAAARELEGLAGRRGGEAGSSLEPDIVAKVVDALERSALAGETLLERLEAAARVAHDLSEAMDFAFLFDEPRQLFAIGYRVADGSLDEGRYDLLASEARLTSFVAIARGDVPATHWFRLARPMTPVESGIALVSWSGSMFEYLMPGLVMRAPHGSLLDQTCRLVVKRQMTYALGRGVPWGISESAYNVRDLDLTYQYSSFGVPGLGLERGLGDDLVIAPCHGARGHDRCPGGGA